MFVILHKMQNPHVHRGYQTFKMDFNADILSEFFTSLGKEFQHLDELYLKQFLPYVTVLNFGIINGFTDLRFT